jgi:hypothetical protein
LTQEQYYSHAEALARIDECERKGARILGMDFLLRDTSGIKPMNSTAWRDLTPEQSWNEARLLLRNGIPDGGNLVVFVTDES